MWSSIVPAAFVAAFVLAPAVTGYAPAWSQDQDFSITNQAPVAGTPFRRDLMQQLQAWWDVHAYYPKHASNNDESGAVKVHLQILPDGKIFSVAVADSSGSKALDAAALSAFRTGAVRPFPEGEPEADLDLSLHYVLMHRHGEALPAGYTATPIRAPFTIANNPVKSPILDTMLQRTCTGTVVNNGGMNQPWRGTHTPVTVVFFRQPDGTPWVRYYENASSGSVSPAVEVGTMVQWVGPTIHVSASLVSWHVYTVWPDGPNHLKGAEGSPIPSHLGAVPVYGMGGPVDLTCSTEVLPAVPPYSSLVVQTMATTPGDPP